MSRRVFGILCFLILAVCSVTAQQSNDEGEWYWDEPISKIEFEGLKAINRSDLSGVVSSYIGLPFTESIYTIILDRLYSIEFFDDIIPYIKHASKNTDDVLVVFQVVEKPIITSISFKGNLKIRNGELREKIKAKVSDVYSETKILSDERIIRSFCLEKGYSNSSVSHQVNKTDKGVDIVFNIKEGMSTVITNITISGNTIVFDGILKNRLTSKEVGLFREGAYLSSNLELDKKEIVKFYGEKGYADASVIDVQITTNSNEKKSRNEKELNFIIMEGFQYVFGGIEFEGNEVFSTRELLVQMKLNKGSIYNSTKFEESLEAITGLYYSNGYMSNEYYPEVIKDSERHIISYKLRIKERTRSHVENIIVKGNTKTKDSVILRELPLETGDVFSRDALLNGLRNLSNTQYFSNIVPEFQGGSEPNLVDIIISVEEQSTMALQVGLTFSGATDPQSLPISGFLKLENSNLFGEGKSVSVSTNLSSSQQSIDFTFGQNWIGKLPIAFSETFSVMKKSATTLVNMWLPNMSFNQTDYYMSYESLVLSLGSALGRRWTPNYAILNLSGGINTSLKINNYNQSISIPVDTSVSQYANTLGLQNTLWASFSVDNRDINYDPSKGWFASEKIAWNGLIPKVEKDFYFRSDTILEAYQTLFNIPITEKWSFKAVLAASTSLSMIFPVAGTTISDTNKLYGDGMIYGRGWTELYNLTDGKGLSLLSNRLELRIPVVPNVLGVDGFFDTVIVKDTPAAMFTSTSLNDIYFSMGPGIRILLPQFPLHLLFAWKFKHDDYGWNMGSSDLYYTNTFQFVLSFNIVNK